MTDQGEGQVSARRGQDRTGWLRGASWLGYLATAIAGLVLLLTWLGPAPSAGLGTLQRLLFWAAHVLSATLLLQAAQMVLIRIPRISRLPPFVQVALAGLVGAVLFTPVALALDVALEPPSASDDQKEPLPLRLAMEFLFLSGPLVLSWVLINAPALVRFEPAEGQATARAKRPADGDLTLLIRQPDSANAAPAGADTAAAADRADLFARLPIRLGRDIVALSAELHYLRVYTPVGDTLILYAFGRAVQAMGAAGLQIHRSHWVSLAHVADVVTRGGQTLCQTDSCLDLPVSRANRRALRDALNRRPEPV
jgi:hypothetical protein